jgi:hypothetical protein
MTTSRPQLAILDKAEIELITGKKQPSAQIAALRTMGISFRQTLAGTPIVSKAALDKWLGNDQTEQATLNKGFLSA